MRKHASEEQGDSSIVVLGRRYQSEGIAIRAIRQRIKGIHAAIDKIYHLDGRHTNIHREQTNQLEALQKALSDLQNKDRL